MTIAFSQLDEAPDPSSKRASRVADRIVRDILRAGWPVGTVLGGEAELLERYDVSRAVFRESVRLLEHLGVATTRRGPGGGLIVTAPSTTGVVQAFLVYLTHAGLTLADLTEARVCVERSVARLAAQRADDSDIAALRERAQADRSRDALDANAHNLLHTMVARAAKNPAAELFVDVLGRLNTRFPIRGVSRSAQREALERSGRAHEVLVDAITAGDVALAERRMGRHLEAIGEYLGRNPRAPSTLEWVLYSDAAEEEKLGSQVARSIIVDIVDRDWPIGEVIGSESELVRALRRQPLRAARGRPPVGASPSRRHEARSARRPRRHRAQHRTDRASRGRLPRVPHHHRRRPDGSASRPRVRRRCVGLETSRGHPGPRAARRAPGRRARRVRVADGRGSPRADRRAQRKRRHRAVRAGTRWN